MIPISGYAMVLAHVALLLITVILSCVLKTVLQVWVEMKIELHQLRGLTQSESNAADQQPSAKEAV